MFKVLTKATQKIVIIPDESFERLDEHTLKLQIRPCDFSKSILISPHRRENRISTDILKFAIYCRQNKKKIIAYGSMNQLPFLGIIADEVILETNSRLSQDMYNDTILTGNGVIGEPKNYSYAMFTDVEHGHMRGESCRAISEEEVVEEFASMDLFIRQSSYRLFQKLSAANTLPKNCIWAEILNYPIVREEMTKYPYHLPVIGLDRSFQQSLLDVHHDHFMAIQILTSFINNVRFLCGGGSANLFVVVPIMAIAMVEQLLHPQVESVYRKLAVRRYGNIGKNIPLISGERAPTLPMESWQEVDEKIDQIQANFQIDDFVVPPPGPRLARPLLL